MAQTSTLILYLVAIAIPSIYCIPMYTPLLDSSCKGLEKFDKEVSKPFLPKDSLQHLQGGKSTANIGGVGSSLETAKGALQNSLTPQSSTPENLSSASWEVCYVVAQKALQSSRSPDVKAMAKAVIHLGLQFNLHQYDPKVKMDLIIPVINLFHLSLEGGSLSKAEMIWSVGVLSFLGSQIPAGGITAIPKVWQAKYLGSPRGHFLLFFLQDKDLGKAIQEMWLHSDQEPSEKIIQEAIQRESIVHHIQRQLGVAPVRPSTSFQAIYLAFINLKTPIDSEKALSLIGLIVKHLDIKNIKNIKKATGFDEEKITIQLLLHLEEYNYESSLRFKELIEIKRLRIKILLRDTSLQLQEELPPDFSEILKHFENTAKVSVPKLEKTLQVLVEEEQISIPQAGRFLRVINLLSKSNSELHTWLNNLLDQNPHMVSRLYKKLLNYCHGQMDPNWFDFEGFEYLIISKYEDQVAEKYRDDLADVLISKGILSKATPVRFAPTLISHGKGYTVTTILHEICKRMLDLKARSHANQEHNVDYVLAEYILHLISFKNNDKKLYRSLRNDMHDPKIFSSDHTILFQKLSHLVLRFVYETFRYDKSRYNLFLDALNILENDLSREYHQQTRGLRLFKSPYWRQN
ncbi:hypothetical protein DFH28DRAFT_982616 [Melampsora americana]|nr:hypothetical protein DFH28DRAFT_982616 [Melampsora americana]